MMNTASWTIPRTPIPRTLPISRSRGADRREDDLDDPALLLLDDAGQDREAEAEDADEDQDRADVGDEELRLVLLGLRPGATSVSGGRCASASAAWSTLLAPRTAWTRSATVAAAMTWAVAWSGCRLTRISPGPDRSAGIVDDDLGAAVVEGRVGGRRVGVGRDRDLVVEALRRLLDGGLEAGRRRLDDADLGRVVAAEHDRRDHERADDDERGEGHAEDEAAAPAAFEDLAPGDQPDASPAGITPPPGSRPPVSG